LKRITILAAALLAGLAAACTPIPNAQKNGTLVKLAKSGMINKTWEAEIVRGGSYTGGTGVQGAPFDFTISDPALLPKVQDAFDNQREVRITYHQSWPSFWSSDSGGNYLDSIEVISSEQGGTDRAGPAPQKTTSASVVGVGTETIETVLKQNQQALDQNERLLKVVEKQVGLAK
jgi:hypothetical protein